MPELSYAAAALLEALSDDRIGVTGEPDAPETTELAKAGLLEPARREEALLLLERRAFERPIEWASRAVAQGDVLSAFAAHCRDDLDDIEVVASTSTRLAVRWRDEESRFELRNGFVGVERIAPGVATMLLGDTEPVLAALVSAYLDDADLRARVAVCDLGRLERLGTVRSSAFVYFEWFLRDAYGVKLLPNGDFTRGLIDRGIISLGMG